MSFIDKYADFIAKQQKDLRASTVNTIEEKKMTKGDIAALKDPKDKIDAKDFAALRAGKHAKTKDVNEAEAQQIDELSDLPEGKWNYPKEITRTVEISDMGNTNAPKLRRLRKELRKKIKAQAHKELMQGKKKNQEMEEPEQIDEVLTKRDPASEWIRDFLASKNPKFAGKSKEKRRQMALAAYYAKQREE